jgi:TetR/AcrR family transcriptional regulator
MEENETEKLILNCARKVFVKKGFDGARMQDIADQAGINKAMLHYYFRSKEKLFEMVFIESISFLLPKLFAAILSEKPIQEKIRDVVISYTDALLINPDIPLFIIREVNSNPERMSALIKSHVQIDKVKEKLSNDIKEAQEKGEFIEIDYIQFLLTLLSSCLFPFIGRNMIKILFGFDDESYNDFILKRKEQLPNLLINGLIKK